MLSNSSLTASKLLIHNAPKCRDSFPLFIEEVFEEPWFIERRRVRIPLATFAEFGDPITWFLRIDDCEKIGWIKKRSAGVVQNPEVICFDADHDVRLTKR